MTRLGICGIIVLISLPVSITDASVDGYLVIPEIELYESVILVEDSDPSIKSYFYDLSDLNYGVGHLQYTSWGNTTGGRTVLVGHTPGAFERINELQVGDTIILSMKGDFYTFLVYEMETVYKTNDAVLSSPTECFEVILITCTNNPEMRLIVKAR